MTKVTGLNELSNIVEYNEFTRKIERKAKKELINQKVAQYISEGVEKNIAEVMANVFYEYEFEMN